LKAAISATYVVLSVTLPVIVSLLSLDIYKSALGQEQQQFQSYQNPTSGVSIQYPSDWQLLEESNDKQRFIKQEGFVTADLNVENLDESVTTLSEYANTRVDELQAQRPEFQLISNEPIAISNKPAQKVVYTFEREEDGKTNKVMRIWSINEGKLYTLAYIAESSLYDRYLPAFQRMVDSFRIGDSDSASSTTQVQSSDGTREDNNGSGNCDRVSYPDPDICIPPYPPDLNCPDIPYKNFQVTGADPHGFDGDNDGMGCDSGNRGGSTPPPVNGDGNCDPSYPDVCIKSPPPDLNCPDIPNKNFKVIGSDPHGFDRDNDGVGCESANEDTPAPPEPPEPEPIGYCNPGLRIIDGICGPYDPGAVYCKALGCPGSPPDQYRPVTPPPTPTDYCWPGPGGVYAQLPGWEEECGHLGEYPGLLQSTTLTPTPTPPVTPTPTPTPAPTPTPPIDPNLLARSQSQPQCEFGVNPETGLCNTEDVTSDPLSPTPEPTITPDEDLGVEEKPEEEVEEEPEEEIVEEPEEEEPEEETDGDNDNSEDSTFGN
jgi:hypothetical protein